MDLRNIAIIIMGFIICFLIIKYLDLLQAFVIKTGPYENFKDVFKKVKEEDREFKEWMKINKTRRK